MKVYMLQLWDTDSEHDYPELIEVLGVFSSLEKAKESSPDVAIMNNDGYICWVEIRECELNDFKARKSLIKVWKKACTYTAKTPDRERSYTAGMWEEMEEEGEEQFYPWTKEEEK